MTDTLNTRAQPGANDAGGDELDVHDRLRHMTDDFKMSQHQCRHQSEQISALQVELAQAKAALRQPAAADNRGGAVEGLKRALTCSLIGYIGTQIDAENIASSIVKNLQVSGLLRTTPEDGKGDVNLPDWVINRIKDNIDAARLNVETTRDADKFIMDHYLFDKDFWEVIYSLIPATQQPEHEGE